MGKERRKAAAQVIALADVTSLMKPARIPPKIPPISNRVDKSAEDFAPKSSPLAKTLLCHQVIIT